MTLLYLVIVCLTILFVQGQHYSNQNIRESEWDVLANLEDRIVKLEHSQRSEYNAAAFEELKSKVDALRIAQGFKVSR